jgi:predicted dinucleotide-binding enzyme
MKHMNVGILGTGIVGQVLGAGFVELGCDVKMGSREPGNPKAAEWAKNHGRHASAGTFEDAAKFGELVVVATLGMAADNALKMAGPKNFNGKIVLDATNPLEFEGGMPRLAIGHNDSMGERIQKALPGAKVVKAYNTVGNAHMVHPKFSGGKPDMFICGNDADAKKTVTELNSAWGWGTVDLGGIEASRLLEPMCLAWVQYGIRTGTWDHAFKLLRK